MDVLDSLSDIFDDPLLNEFTDKLLSDIDLTELNGISGDISQSQDDGVIDVSESEYKIGSDGEGRWDCSNSTTLEALLKSRNPVSCVPPAPDLCSDLTKASPSVTHLKVRDISNINLSSNHRRNSLPTLKSDPEKPLLPKVQKAQKGSMLCSSGRNASNRIIRSLERALFRVSDGAESPYDRSKGADKNNRRAPHNAIEKRYRASINGRIDELRKILIPYPTSDAKMNKSAVLRQAIDRIRELQEMNERLQAEVLTLRSLHSSCGRLHMCPIQSGPVKVRRQTLVAPSANNSQRPSGLIIPCAAQLSGKLSDSSTSPPNPKALPVVRQLLCSPTVNVPPTTNALSSQMVESTAHYVHGQASGFNGVAARTTLCVAALCLITVDLTTLSGSGSHTTDSVGSQSPSSRRLLSSWSELLAPSTTPWSVWFIYLLQWIAATFLCFWACQKRDLWAIFPAIKRSPSNRRLQPPDIAKTWNEAKLAVTQGSWSTAENKLLICLSELGTPLSKSIGMTKYPLRARATAWLRIFARTISIICFRYPRLLWTVRFWGKKPAAPIAVQAAEPGPTPTDVRLRLLEVYLLAKDNPNEYQIECAVPESLEWTELITCCVQDFIDASVEMLKHARKQSDHSLLRMESLAKSGFMLSIALNRGCGFPRFITVLVFEPSKNCSKLEPYINVLVQFNAAKSSSSGRIETPIAASTPQDADAKNVWWARFIHAAWYNRARCATLPTQMGESSTTCTFPVLERPPQDVLNCPHTGTLAESAWLTYCSLQHLQHAGTSSFTRDSISDCQRAAMLLRKCLQQLSELNSTHGAPDQSVTDDSENMNPPLFWMLACELLVADWQLSFLSAALMPSQCNLLEETVAQSATSKQTLIAFNTALWVMLQASSLLSATTPEWITKKLSYSETINRLLSGANPVHSRLVLMHACQNSPILTNANIRSRILESTLSTRGSEQPYLLSNSSSPAAATVGGMTTPAPSVSNSRLLDFDPITLKNTLSCIRPSRCSVLTQSPGQ
ncbi:sterol regulatory element-binding protein 1 [Clonorchis sinensis]|uniref:Sterol regulatory element-binding protein 1 n=1 Tax=Clonorchis sinensis TaxID=79923 RepID=G7YQ22_CLOSI|nr:sterol regulatory element-binding protein 1 [Clonorchis sinensis]